MPTETYTCPHCHKPILSPRAQRSLDYMRAFCPARGGYMFEGARPAYEAGQYHDPDIAELLACGAIRPHPDPNKGWVVAW